MDGEPPRIVFLYKLVPGVCSDSYGYNVARMAGFPIALLRLAEEYGDLFQFQFTLQLVTGECLLEQAGRNQTDATKLEFLIKAFQKLLAVKPMNIPITTSS